MWSPRREWLYGTPGPYDLVAVTAVPDDETGTAINLALASTGNLRTLTMRAFSEGEMEGILARMGQAFRGSKSLG